MTNEVKNVPELRFPEFSDCWQEKQLGELASVTKLAGFEFTKYVKYSDFGEIPAIRGLNVKNGDFVFSDVKYIDDSDFSKLSRSKLESDNIVYTYVGTIGDAAIVPVNKLWYLAPNVAKIVTKSIEPKFLLQILLDSNFKKKEVLSWISTSSQPALSMTNIRKFKMQIPKSSIEQEKIGDFFSKLDRQIELEEQKLEKLEEQKKGYMQKLFSQELRFKDENGYGFPNWRYNYLENYIIPYDEKTTENNQYPVLTSSREGLFLQKDYFTRDVASKDNTGYNVVPYGYFTYRHMSDDLIFKFNINYIVQKGIVSTLYPVFKTTNDLDNYFLKEILNNGNEFKKYALMQKQGGSRTYMYFSKLKKLKLHIPVLEEQQKIGDFLFKIDKLIENQSKKIDFLKQRKQGLLQKMFV